MYKIIVEDIYGCGSVDTFTLNRQHTAIIVLDLIQELTGMCVVVPKTWRDVKREW